MCSASAQPAVRLKLFTGTWVEILERHDLETLARVMLPVVFGEEFLRRNEKIFSKMVRAVVARNRKDAVLAQLRACMNYPPLARPAHRVRSPVLVLRGSDDPLVTESGARELAGLCNGMFKEIPGVGHSIPVEAPDLFVAVLKEFLLCS